jgi:hypothetical protein
MRLKNSHLYKRENLFVRKVGVPWSGDAGRTDFPSAKGFVRSFLNTLYSSETEIAAEDYFFGNALDHAYEICERIRNERQGKAYKIADEVSYPPCPARLSRRSSGTVTAVIFSEGGEAAFLLRFHLNGSGGSWKITAIEQGFSE